MGHNNRIANQAIRLNWDDCAEFCCQLLENDVSISELKLTKIIEKENRLVLLVIPEAKALALPRASKKRVPVASKSLPGSKWGKAELREKNYPHVIKIRPFYWLLERYNNRKKNLHIQ